MEVNRKWWLDDDDDDVICIVSSRVVWVCGRPWRNWGGCYVHFHCMLTTLSPWCATHSWTTVRPVRLPTGVSHSPIQRTRGSSQPPGPRTRISAGSSGVAQKGYGVQYMYLGCYRVISGASTKCNYLCKMFKFLVQLKWATKPSKIMPASVLSY